MVNITGQWRLDFFSLHEVTYSQDQTTRASLVKKPNAFRPREPPSSNTMPNCVASFQTCTSKTPSNLSYFFSFPKEKWDLSTWLPQRNAVINNVRRTEEKQKEPLSKGMLAGHTCCHQNNQRGCMEWNWGGQAGTREWRNQGRKIISLLTKELALTQFQSAEWRLQTLTLFLLNSVLSYKCIWLAKPKLQPEP